MRALAVTSVLAIVASAIFGLIPALQAAGLGCSTRSRRVGARRPPARVATGRALVVAEIALALPLLVASALGANGAYRFLNGPQGYDPEVSCRWTPCCRPPAMPTRPRNATH
jgi:hypothetical protein